MVKKSNSIQTIAIDFIQNKNNKNFSKLIDRLKPGLYSLAYKYLKDNDLANEVVTQTFINIWEKIHQYRTEFNFSTWAYAIAKNEALGLLRTQNKTVSYDQYLANHSKVLAFYSPSYEIDTECMMPTGKMLVEKLYDASISEIQELNEPYKTVMLEREVKQRQLQDIADELGWNLSTVKTRLRKGRQDLACILNKKYPEMIEVYYSEME